MNIFFSGIGGVGLGPLAEIAKAAGYSVSGTDTTDSLMVRELRDHDIAVEVTDSDDYLRLSHSGRPVDWLVYTSALPADHPELQAAHELGIKVSKRDELLAHIITEKNLKLIAVAGTHGKTTTTGMVIWAMKQLGIPISYSIGTTVNFGPSGQYDPASEYFVYECDEFDRNFLAFSPALSLITSLGYDHSDTYPTKNDYYTAFSQFLLQSDHAIGWRHDLKQLMDTPDDRLWQLQDNEISKVELAGEHNRRNATLVLKGLEYLGLGATEETLSSFPGTNRRFEKLGDNLYSDYGHHPTEIAATLQMAHELNDHVVLVYQPHQNVRQYEIKSLYSSCFKRADRVYWLPTYLSRENPDLAILSPAELSANVTGTTVQLAEMNDELWTMLELHRESGDMVLCMGAGSIDGWVRSRL